MKQRTVIVRITEPADMAPAARIAEAELTTPSKTFPVIYDYETRDKENRTKKNLLSFVVYETKQALVIKRVRGKEREKFLVKVKG